MSRYLEDGPAEIPSRAVFVQSEGTPLHRSFFIDTFAVAGVNPPGYSDNSFRIGAATAATGIPDHLIKTHDRWSSDCHIRCVQVADESPRSAWYTIRWPEKTRLSVNQHRRTLRCAVIIGSTGELGLFEECAQSDRGPVGQWDFHESVHGLCV